MILRKINPILDEHEYLGNIENHNNDFIDTLVANDFILPNDTPVELHPYLADFELKPSDKYIIGTFPPIQYLRDSLDIPDNIGNIRVKPKVPFFHGQNCDMWNYFFMQEELNEIGIFDTNNPNDLRYQQRDIIIEKLFLSDINYSDVISSTKRQQYNANDDSLFNIIPNFELIVHILRNEKSNYLNFNTSALFNGGNSFGFYINNHGANNVGDLRYKIQSYEIFLKTLSCLGFKIEMQLNPNHNWVQLDINNAQYFSDNYKFKVLSKLRVIADEEVRIHNYKFENFDREFTIITGPSPSGQASVSFGRNEVYINWLANQNINANDSPTNLFRSQFYTGFRNNPDDLINWNVY